VNEVEKKAIRKSYDKKRRDNGTCHDCACPARVNKNTGKLGWYCEVCAKRRWQKEKQRNLKRGLILMTDKSIIEKCGKCDGLVATANGSLLCRKAGERGVNIKKIKACPQVTWNETVQQKKEKLMKKLGVKDV